MLASTTSTPLARSWSVVDGLDRRRRAHGHEGRRADVAARRGDLAEARAAVGGHERESEALAHGRGRRVEQAGIAVGVEAIAGRDGVGVGGAHGVEAAEGRDQHEQRRARQMEVGHQQIDGLEAVAGRDEEVRLACEGLDGARFPSPLWGGVRGGGSLPSASPPPVPPPRGGGTLPSPAAAATWCRRRRCGRRRRARR